MPRARRALPSCQHRVCSLSELDNTADTGSRTPQTPPGASSLRPRAACLPFLLSLPQSLLSPSNFPHSCDCFTSPLRSLESERVRAASLLQLLTALSVLSKSICLLCLSFSEQNIRPTHTHPYTQIRSRSLPSPGRSFFLPDNLRAAC